jgi:hypothetical protein
MKRGDISTLIVLEAAEKAHSEKEMMTWQYIEQKTNAPEKIIYAAMQREDKRGFLEWGVSLRTAWLTVSGIAELEKLRGR